MTAARIRLFVLLAAVAAAIFVRLGVWQLHRRQERRARNALIVARLAEQPVDARSLPRDTASVRFRRVRVTGTPDYAHELIYAVRTRAGSPGVNLMTPVRLPGTDTAVLVNRGWVYSPDGSTIDEARWRDHDSVFTGFAEPLAPKGGATYTNRPTIIARLSYGVVQKALPFPILPFYVIALGTRDTSNAANRIARLTIPPLDEGPHLNYAIQWFGFAAVTLIGVIVVVGQARSGADRVPRFPDDSVGGASGPG